MTRKTKNEPRFSRNALLHSELFRHEKDLICALIASDEYCTVQEVQDRINKYKKGKVT